MNVLLLQGGLVKSVLDLYELRNKDLAYTTPIATTATTTATTTAATDPDSEADTAGAAVPAEAVAVSLRGRKGWGDKSVNHLLAAVDKARLLEDHR